MIQSILQKCLDNLNAATPDLSYIRGMIEVLLAMQETPLMNSSTVEHLPVKEKVVGSIPTSPADEASVLDAKARAALETIKSLAQKSVEV